MNTRSLLTYIIIAIFICSCASQHESGLVGYWKLKGDSKDYSGNGNDGINHGVNLDSGSFEDKKSFIEVPSSASLKLGADDFTISVWVNTPDRINDIVGDVLDMYDPVSRKGFTFSINTSAGGYQGQGTDRHVHFGIDNAQQSDWEDCGRPSATSNYISNSLTVFKGKLYAAITEAKDQKDWAHVYRYDGGQKWIDCGRVGNARTTGVMPMIVHNGELYAATATYDWTRISSGDFEAGSVYKYKGGTNWEQISNPIDSNNTLNTMGSYNGKLYVGGGPVNQAVYTQGDGKEWVLSKKFLKEGPLKCFPHTFRTYRNKLFTAYPSAYSFDGQEWTYAGVPSEPESTLQTHSMNVYKGDLIAGTWPVAKVARYKGGQSWEDMGRVGEDGTEVNSLVVYNGKLYGGSIPRAEVGRYDGGDTVWSMVKRFYSPEGWTPVPPRENGGSGTGGDYKEWTRVTSLTVYNGKLFAGIGSCTSSQLDAPADIRGKIFNMEAGKNVSYDDDLGTGWKHLVAKREGDNLKLYIDGKLVSTSTSFKPGDYDISNDQPLRIGFGQTDYFTGKMSELKIYKRALEDSEIKKIYSAASH